MAVRWLSSCLSAKCTNNIDSGSLKDKGLPCGDVVFGFGVSVVDPFVLEMKVRHSDRNELMSNNVLLRYSAVELKGIRAVAARCLKYKVWGTGNLWWGRFCNDYPLPPSLLVASTVSYLSLALKRVHLKSTTRQVEDRSTRFLVIFSRT